MYVRVCVDLTKTRVNREKGGHSDKFYLGDIVS